MNKENKKDAMIISNKFVSVTTERNKPVHAPHNHASEEAFNENEHVLNSTAQSTVSTSDLKHSDFDLSIRCSSIHGFSTMKNLNNLNEIFSQQTTSNLNKPDTSEDSATSSDPNIRQAELDELYIDYLLSLYKIEVRKKCFREEEEIMMKDLLDAHLARETLKKEILELDLNGKYLDSLIELAKFLNALNEFVKNNSDSLKRFESNFEKLSELCNRVKRFLIMRNIYIPDKAKFEESFKTELKSTTELLKKFLNQPKMEKIPNAPEFQQDDKVNYKLLIEIVQKCEKLRNCLVELISIIL